MLFLVFPKPFERNLFVQALHQQKEKLQLVLVPIHEMLAYNGVLIGVTQKTPSADSYSTLWFFTAVIKDSDIGFHKEFTGLLSFLKTRFPTVAFRFVLCGTSGGSGGNGINATEVSAS